jgi:hypothetical protein
MSDPTPLFGVGLAAAFVAGLSGSLHCALMCGPLACAPLPRAGGAGRLAALGGWHLGRLAAYAVVGAALGAAGGGLAAGLQRYVQPVLPWLMVVGFVASAFEFGRRLPAAGALGGLARRLASWGQGASPFARAAALGAATPFLPCGLLWGIFLVAVGAGSAAGGAAILVAFGLGSTPGLGAVQLGTAWTGRWPRAERVLKVAVPLVAAAAVAWRAIRVGDPGAHSGHGGTHH